MTTSESRDFNLTRNEIIRLAYLKIGAIGDNQYPSNDKYNIASMLLNSMVQNWRGDDVFIWDQEWFVLPLAESSTVLSSDGSGDVFGCVRNHLSAADNRPISGDQSASFWQLLEGETAAPAWTTATDYTSISNYKFDADVVGIDLAKVRVATPGQLLDQPLLPMTNEMFWSLGTPQTTGKPTSYYFRRQPIPEVFLYPTPDSATSYIIEFNLYRYLQDFDTGANTPGLLKEWLSPLIDGLAVKLAPINGKFGQIKKDLDDDFEKSYAMAKKLDHEMGPTRFSPRMRR